MIVLTIRTDQPEAEIGLYQAGHQLAREGWPAYRVLAETIHTRIRDLLHAHHMQLTDVQAIVVYRGPGSFTGLRIGLTVADMLAYGLAVPIVGATGERWNQDGLDRLAAGESDGQVLPEYGAPVHVTLPKR